MRVAAGVGLLVLLLNGCGAYVRTTRLASYPPLPANTEVSIFSVRVPDCEFEELGLVTIREGIGARGEELVVEMKAEARRMGGNALVGLRAVPKAKKMAHGISATVARFRDPTCVGDQDDLT